MKTIQTTEWDELQKKFGNFVKVEVEEDNHEERNDDATKNEQTNAIFDEIKACYRLERVMEDVAHKYRLSRTKFRRAEARDIIPNYPERNLPTLILYRNGDVVENIVGIEQFGGMNGVNTETVRRRVRMKSDEFLMDRGEEEAKEAEKRREKEIAKNG
ncbi:unnamed protein product [Bathycoccus prasinos]